MPHIITNDRGESIDLNTTEGQYRYVANALVQHGVHSQILAALADLNRTAERAQKLDAALRDAVSTYMGADKLVTAERIEAWQAALGNGEPFS
jgi:uncharacterized protein YqfA (UPF0365 family)